MLRVIDSAEATSRTWSTERPAYIAMRSMSPSVCAVSARFRHRLAQAAGRFTSIVSISPH
jgi:hypothetical protein